MLYSNLNFMPFLPDSNQKCSSFVALCLNIGDYVSNSNRPTSNSGRSEVNIILVYKSDAHWQTSPEGPLHPFFKEVTPGHSRATSALLSTYKAR